MRYKVGNTFYGKDWDQGFSHYGIRGMAWGKRRFQNLDGSLTTAGMQRYNVGEGQPNFGRNIQSEVRQRSMGAAISDSIRSKPARQREAYASRFANNSPAKPQYMIGSRPVDSIGKHIQQRQNAQNSQTLSSVGNHIQKRNNAWNAYQQKQYENSPRGQAEAFLNKVGRGAGAVANRVGEGAQQVGRSVVDSAGNLIQTGKNVAANVGDSARRMGENAINGVKSATGLGEREAYINAQRQANAAQKLYNNHVDYVRKEADLSREDLKNGKINQNDYDNWMDQHRKFQSQSAMNYLNAQRDANRMKEGYDQSPLGRVENFANQVGQGAQNAWNSAANGVQQFGQNVGNFANQVGQGAQNAWNQAISGAQQLGQNIGNFAGQLGNQIDQGLNLGVNTGRILDAARQDREAAMNNFNNAQDLYREASKGQAAAQGNYDKSRAQYNTAAGYDPNMSSAAAQKVRDQFGQSANDLATSAANVNAQRQVYRDAMSQLANATRAVDSWEQQYGGTVIGGVRNAINQGQQILSDLLSKLFGR